MDKVKREPFHNGYEGVRTVKRVDALEIENLPKGEFSKLFIDVVENGIGRSIQIPVVVARGMKEGPVFGITAALHGNELNGIPVLHQLLQRINLKSLKGNMVCVIAANMPGLLNHQREFTDGVDLNHIMPGKPYGKLSHVYAHELVDRIISHFDYLVDLHTASEGRVNSLYVRADLSEPVTAQMAFLLRPQIIVHNPPSDYTLRGVVAENGKPAITVEICDPAKFQKDPIKRTVQGIRRIMNHLGMTSTRISASKAPKPPKPPILCSKSSWVLAERGGMIQVKPKATQYLKKGDPIATQVNIFGEVVHEYSSPDDGIVIGHATNPLGQTGERIIHLGLLMSEEQKKKFESVSGCSLEGEASELPGKQEVPSVKPV